jgi:hypothetical protein
MTPAKIYLGRPEINFDVKEIKDSLNSLGIQSIFEDILGNRVIRTLNLEDLNLYATAGGLTRLIPPILADSIKKSYLWKKFRRR